MYDVRCTMYDVLADAMLRTGWLIVHRTSSIVHITECKCLVFVVAKTGLSK